MQQHIGSDDRLLLTCEHDGIITTLRMTNHPDDSLLLGMG